MEDLGKQLTLWVNKSQPKKVLEPSELIYYRFGPESEYKSQIPFEDVTDPKVPKEEE
jgi:hypothetical protein